VEINKSNPGFFDEQASQLLARSVSKPNREEGAKGRWHLQIAVFAKIATRAKARITSKRKAN